MLQIDMTNEKINDKTTDVKDLNLNSWSVYELGIITSSSLYVGNLEWMITSPPLKSYTFFFSGSDKVSYAFTIYIVFLLIQWILPYIGFCLLQWDFWSCLDEELKLTIHNTMIIGKHDNMLSWFPSDQHICLLLVPNNQRKE